MARPSAHTKLADRREAIVDFIERMFRRPWTVVGRLGILAKTLRRLVRARSLNPVRWYIIASANFHCFIWSSETPSAPRTYVAGDDTLDPQYFERPDDLSEADRVRYFDPVTLTDGDGPGGGMASAVRAGGRARGHDMTFTYRETRENEHLRLLTPAIDAFIRRYPDRRPRPRPRRVRRCSSLRRRSHAAARATEKFRDGVAKPQTFDYEVVWVTEEALDRGTVRNLKMHRDRAGVFRDKGDRIIVASGVIWSVLYDGFIDWCAANNLDLFVFDWDWRLRAGGHGHVLRPPGFCPSSGRGCSPPGGRTPWPSSR